MRGGSGGWRAVVVTAALLAVVAVLLWRPLLRVRTHTFGPFQLMAQHTTLTWQPGCEEETNGLLSDPAVEMHPWALFAARELRAGRLPLWNPCNAAGEPLLANYQSALLSPFTLPYYALPLKAAVLASALLKLLAAGTFAYLFLRRVGCTTGAALLGGAALAASGTCLVLIQHPHAGVFALLPACLYGVEVLCARCEAPARSGRALAGAAAGLALAIGVSALAGHPETLLFSYMVVAAYAAYRTATLAAAPARRLAAAGWLAAAALTGLALGAVQTLPFAEYLGQSAVFGARRLGSLIMVLGHWPLQFFPYLPAPPWDPQFGAGFDMGALFQDVASFFVGGVVLLCASIGLLRARRPGPARFFAALAALWMVYANDLFGACTWLNTHTSLAHVPVSRTHPLWVPSVCFLAALGVSGLERSEASAGWRRGLFCLALAAGLFALFHWGARAYLDQAAGLLGLARAELPAYADRHLATMGALFALGAEGLVLIASTRRRWLRVAGHAALIASVVAGSALTIADYVPTVRDRYVYPQTAAIESLQGALGGERVLFLTTSSLPAELNLAYGVGTIESYDAVGVGDCLRLIDHFFGVDALGIAAEPRRASKGGLQLFGVRYVATRSDWVPIETDLGDLLVSEQRISAYNAWEWIVKELVPWPQPRKELSLELQASRDGLDGVAVQFIEDSAALTSVVTLRLIDVDQDRELARVERRLGLMPVLPMLVEGDGRCELVARFDPLPDSKGRKLALEISTTGERGDARPRVVRSPWGRPERPRQIPMVDLGYGQSEFERVSRDDTHTLYRFTGSPGRAWIVGTALAAATHEQAFELVVGPEFEPLEQVVLERDSGAGEAHAGPFELEILGEQPCRWRFEASCATPGWLVVAQAFYPGWKARIDGQESEVLRANYGLTAVELPAGQHEVVLEYDPPSFRIGAWCSASAAGLIALGLVLGRRRSLDAGRRPPPGARA